jgi:hypothetical protein
MYGLKYLQQPSRLATNLEVEHFLLIDDISWNDHECEDDPEQEGVYGEEVYGEEGTIDEKNAGPSDNGSDEFGAVGDTNDICARPDIKTTCGGKR